MKKIISLILAAAMAVSLAGCGRVSEDFAASLDEIAELYLRLDEDSIRFDRALERLGEYLEGDISQKEALEAFEKDLSYYEKELAEIEEYELEEDLESSLIECGIYVQDFLVFANMRSHELYEYRDKAAVLLEYLTYAEQFRDARESLEFYHRYYGKLQSCNKGYYFYGGLNYWFAEADGKELALLEEVLLNEIGSLRPAKDIWYTESAHAEEAAQDSLDTMEECVTEISAFMGESRNMELASQRVFQKLKALTDAMVQEDLTAAPYDAMSSHLNLFLGDFAKAIADDDYWMVLAIEGEVDALAEAYQEAKAGES